MIIPIGHEENTVRRQPWVTYGLMALCVVVFLVTHFATQDRIRQGIERLEQAFRYYQEHPYLELDPRLQELAWGSSAGADKAREEWLRQLGARGDRDPQFASLEQAELDGLTRAGFDALADTPQRRWGLVPADFSPLGLVTHMFLHAGWLHLLGNLLFLYLAGPFVEDVWGRRLFAGFYLLAGMVAALGFTLRYPGLDVPLIGASGAIAGVIGAFAVRHWNRRIRFFYWFGLVFRGTFSSPAWVILPLWFVRELLAAYTLDVVAPGAGGGGVAYWAHVSGFVFGVGAAALLKFTGWEERFVAPAVEERHTVLHESALERALEQRAGGHPDQAWTLLNREVRRDPGNPDKVVALWDLAVDTNRVAEAAPHLVRLIQDRLRQGEVADACAHWHELSARAPQHALPPAVAIRLVEQLRGDGRDTEAAQVLDPVLEQADGNTPAGALVRLTRLCTGPDQARLAALALAHPELPEAVRRELQPLAASSPPDRRADADGVRPGDRGPAPRVGGPTPARPAPPHAFQVTRAIPLGLDPQRLGIEIPGQGSRALPLKRIAAVATAAIADGGVEPNLILDLVLVPPAQRQGARPVVRLESVRFDPRRLVPSESDPEDALVSLAGSILAGSGASWALGSGAGGLRQYPSLQAYERELAAALAL